tara:strand:- start:6111 stop:6263 length:153 start_codon:yes stop_codon:yes gene_type:complete
MEKNKRWLRLNGHKIEWKQVQEAKKAVRDTFGTYVFKKPTQQIVDELDEL